MQYPPMLFPEPACFDALIFDCDGTLVDTMPLFYRAWRDSLRRYGSRYDFRWDFFCAHGGQRTQATLDEICRTGGESIDFPTLKRYQAEFIGPRLGEVPPIRPVVDFARHCHRIPRPLAVASGGYRDYVRRALEAIGVADLFPVIVACEDVLHTKPAPDLFLLAAERLGVRPQRCLVLEDSLFGIQAAAAAGMASWLLPALPTEGRLDPARDC